MLLMTPVWLSHAPVRMAVQDGLEIVVWPTMLATPVTLSPINASKFGLSPARIRRRLVPSTPITSTWTSVGSATSLMTEMTVVLALR